MRRFHADRLAGYEELERRLRERHGVAGAAGRADPAFTGALLVVRCGVQSERGYLRWCDEAAAIVAARDIAEA